MSTQEKPAFAVVDHFGRKVLSRHRTLPGAVLGLARALESHPAPARVDVTKSGDTYHDCTHLSAHERLRMARLRTLEDGQSTEGTL